MLKQTRLSEKDKRGIWLIGVVALLFLLIIGFRLKLGEPPRVGSDNCIGKPDANTVIVIDRSDGVSAQTLAEVRARALNYIEDSTRENERVSVFTVSAASANSLAPLISLCRPAASGNRLVQNVKGIQKRFHDNFELPIDSALELPPGHSPQTPIAQALIDISQSTYLRGSRNTLLVFSDMLENTTAFSLYGCSDANSVVGRFRQSRLGGVERPSFVNTKVVLNLIPRTTRTSTALHCRDSLWVWFFGDDPGPDASVRLDYLPGSLATIPQQRVQ